MRLNSKIKQIHRNIVGDNSDSLFCRCPHKRDLIQVILPTVDGKGYVEGDEIKSHCDDCGKPVEVRVIEPLVRGNQHEH